MTNTELTASQLAALRGCTVNYVYQQNLPKTKDKLYDLSNPEVRDFFLEPFKKQWLRDLKTGRTEEELEANSLQEKKTKEQINLYKKQGRKLDLDHKIKKKDLVPMDMIAKYLGYFAAGIRINFLSIGNNVAKGDTVLRDKIEKLVEKAIAKTLENAAANLRKEGKKIIEEMEK